MTRRSWPPFSVIYFASGNRYEGEWISDQQMGRGTFADASQYVDDWNCGARHGRGALLYVDGLMYSGEWREGEKWSGMHYDESRKVLSSFFGGIEIPR